MQSCMIGDYILGNEIENAVQPDNWYDDLPRPQYASLEQVHAEIPWFKIYKLTENIYAIYEPSHFQEVISYLVIGKDKALLIDTGMGMADIKEVIDTLTKLPLVVVNTHSHFDHIGGNHLFSEVHILNHSAALKRLENGLSREQVKPEMIEGSIYPESPVGFNPKEYHIEPCKSVPIESGHVFDLGGMKIEVISTPGHSPDSIMLFCDEEKFIFTGDTFYPATLYAHLTAPDGITSVIEIYRDTMRKVADRFSDYTVYASHNEPIREGRILTAVADAFDAIENSDIIPLIDPEGLKKYQFDGFAIVTK